jgi:peptidoglycan LD-endopeptidase LytH
MRSRAATFALGFGLGLLTLAVVLAVTGRLPRHAGALPVSAREQTPEPAQAAEPRDGVPAERQAPADAAAPAESQGSAESKSPAKAEVAPRAAPAEAPPLELPDRAGAHQPAAAPDSPAAFDLASRNLGSPIAGLRASDLHDTFAEARGSGRVHEALDIMAPRGTPVLAVDEGNVAKLFTSEQGGLTVYQFDNRREICYYYAHLDRYAPGLQEGMLLRKGDLVGYVGSSGNADPSAPHLHFAVFRLGSEKNWWAGTPVNPYQALLRAAKR